MVKPALLDVITARMSDAKRMKELPSDENNPTRQFCNMLYGELIATNDVTKRDYLQFQSHSCLMQAKYSQMFQGSSGGYALTSKFYASIQLESDYRYHSSSLLFAVSQSSYELLLRSSSVGSASQQSLSDLLYSDKPPTYFICTSCRSFPAITFV